MIHFVVNCLEKCKVILENKELIQSHYDNVTFQEYLNNATAIFSKHYTIVLSNGSKFLMIKGVCNNASLFDLNQIIEDNLELIGLTKEKSDFINYTFGVNEIIDYIAFSYLCKKYNGYLSFPYKWSLVYPIQYDLKTLWLEEERWEYLNHVIVCLENMVKNYENLFN